ncbi:hypothetical protein HMPREF1248_0831 [Coriobacteriaceae bacterium BV3Ac1]|nr:hypothetical protein HMPREF1248_0831 [Coriobacteriaceae bacterium BV3Ac1]
MGEVGNSTPRCGPACQTPHIVSIGAASACQTPRSVSEKMSKATFRFKEPDVSAGKFFSREMKRGFWLKK